MCPAPEYLYFGQRQPHLRIARQVAPEIETLRVRRGVEDGHRGRDRRVAAKAREILRPIEFREPGIHGILIARIHAGERRRDPSGHVGDSSRHIETAERRTTVAQIDRLEPAARGAGRRHAAPPGAARQLDIDLDGRATSGIPDPASANG